MTPSHLYDNDGEDIVIRLQDVSKTYRIYDHPSHRLRQFFSRGRSHFFREHTALKPLSLTISRGHTIGVVGVNGSGKSTLLQLITGTLTPTTGSVRVKGRISALLELGAGFNPEFSGRDNIFLNASIMGLSQEETEARYDEIVRFSGLDPAMLSQPVSTYSSGMYVRLAFAVAISVEPDILIVDEALAVGDEGFQRKCFSRIRSLQENGATILFVSHSARTIVDLCDSAMLIDAGELLLQGEPANVVAHYHKMLFASETERPAIRQQLANASASVRTAEAIPATMVTTDVTPIPESRLEYPPEGGHISNIRLLDRHHQPVSHLIVGESYDVRFTFTADKELSQLRMTMMLKTMTGIELAGTMARGQGQLLQQVAHGSHIDVTFRFICTLVKGDYFLNVGVVEEQFGTYRFIHRIVDALHLKVMESDQPLRDGHIEARGFIDIGAECDITLLESSIG